MNIRPALAPVIAAGCIAEKLIFVGTYMRRNWGVQ